MSGTLPLSEYKIGQFVNLSTGINECENLINNLKESTENLYLHFGTSQRTVRHFQDHLTRISSFLCNRENIIDDLTELLKKSQISSTLKQRISENTLDERYELSIKELKETIEISKTFQKKEFIIGFEMQKELDPLIDRAAKRILSHCTDLLANSKDLTGKPVAKLHEIQQLNLLPLANLMEFVEENRPTASSTFIGKYCELSSSYYASCVKGFFEDLKQNNRQIFKKINNQLILIGDPIEGDDVKIRRKSSFTLYFLKRPEQQQPITSPKDSDSTNLEISQISDIPYNGANLLIELLRRESTFFKEFFGSSYVRRKSLLNKIFFKCFGICKTNLKEILAINSNCLDLIKMMSEVTQLEVQVVSMSDLASPTQWLNEIQNCLFEEFKRHLKKHLDSLSSYPELKTTLSSGELRHHFVVKRFANFMKSSLEILTTFQRPWEIVQVELKKLERAFYNWMIKVSSYIKDRREALLFQINNFDLVIEACSSLAGADFMASLHFKYDPLIDKYVHLEQERYFYDLLLALKDPNTLTITSSSEINLKTQKALNSIMDTFYSSTFTDFSSFSVSESIRRSFAQKTLEIYSKYYVIYDEKFGKCELNENEIVPVELDVIEKIIYNSLK